MTEPGRDDPHAQVRAALASARRALLDLTFRNHFLNYRVLRARGVVVAGDDAPRVARLLLDDDVPLSFVTRQAAERRRAMRLEAEAEARAAALGDGEREADGTGPDAHGDELAQATLRYAVDDRVLVADHGDDELARRLDATRKTARTFVEERGVNTLFVALGTLHWSESGDGSSERTSPLFMVPVTLEVASVAHGARLRYDGEDPQGNPTLRERLRPDGIDLPLPDDDVRLGDYLDRVERAVADRPGWRVDRSHVSLGFFSFTRYLMYLDLDESRWPDPARVLEHPVVSAALATGFSPAPAIVDPAARLDEQAPYGRLQGVLEADGSQSEAIVEALERTALVIQGPPGTGKSQTIANVLAEALSRGQRVLFVAEKKAALDVVKRRLDAVGLGDAALELHSYTATRAAVVADLRRTMELGRPRVGDATPTRERLERVRRTLNDYVDALHAPIGATGATPYELIGRAESAAASAREPFDLAAAGVDPTVERTPEAFERLRGLARTLEAWADEEGEPGEHPFRHARLETASPGQTRRVEEAVSDAIAALVAYEAALDPLSDAPFAGAPATLAAAEARVHATRSLLELLAAGVRVDLGDPTWSLGRDALAAAAEAASEAEGIRARGRATIDPGAWSDPSLDVDAVASLRADLTERDDVIYRWFSGRHRAAFARVRGWLRPGSARSRADALLALDVLGEHAVVAARFDDHAVAWRSALPGHGDLAEASAVAGRVATFVAALDRAGGRLHPDGTAALATIDAQTIDTALVRVAARVSEARERLTALASLLELDVAAAFDGARNMGEAPLASLTALLKAWRREPRRIAGGARWRRLRREAEEGDALALWEALTRGAVRAEALEARLARALEDAWLEHAFAERSPLARFEGRAHEATIAEFRALDAEQLALHRALASSVHFAGLPAMSGHGEVGVLLQEFNKRRRHRSVRRLMEEAGNAVQAIKPIFLMSPLSVATFLPTHALRFDLVVFDEASQVRPADALGALLRADRAVVVGDDRQLPPTTFFDALIEEVHPDDEDAMVGDVESVLGMFGARGAPTAWLAWHYRSRHESLIAVSNREFYEERLMLFPSPDVVRDDAGVTLHHLPDAVYDRGRSRTNAREAVAVAEAVRAHAHRRPERTLGVATFAMPQADAIEREVERLAGEDAVLRAFVQAHPLEPFFVKPLEAVQGDERDEIIVSVGYGRDADGRLTYQFGPLNQVGGERRLNVLITRARWRTHVFSNVTDEDLDPRRCTAVGLRTLRTYLAFARTGAFERAEVAPVDGATPLTEVVAAALVERGHDVHRRIGHAGSFIDLAIADPERPGRMLLAVECDGATYRNVRAARDRDRLRPAVLEGLGWRIHRVWSSDWWRDPEASLARIEESLADAVRHARAADAGSSGPPAELPLGGVERDDARLWNDATLRFTPYTVAMLAPIPFDGSNLSRAPTQDVAAWLEQVVAVEGAVHVEDAFRRIVDASNATRIGSRIRERLEHGVAAGVRSGRFGRVGDVLVPNDVDAATFRPRDRSALEGRDRDFARVPPFELDAAIEAVVRASHGIDASDVARAVARLLGFARTTDDVHEAISARVAQMLDDGALELGARGEVRVGRALDGPR